MNIDEMTPEQLREYALAKEQSREGITAKYMAYPAEKKQPWEKTVEFEGREYDVDMRKLHSREFLRRIAEAQNDEMSTAEQMDLFEFVFDGTCAKQVEATVTETMGYVDYIEVLRIEAGIFEAIDAKN